MGFGLRDREGWLQVPGEVERGWWPSLMKTMQRHNTIPFKLPKAKTSDNTQWKPVTHKHTTYYMLLLQVEHDTVKPLWENKHQISSFPFSPCGSPLLSLMKAGTFFFFSDRFFYSLSRKELNSGNCTAFSTDSKYSWLHRLSSSSCEEHKAFPRIWGREEFWSIL